MKHNWIPSNLNSQIPPLAVLGGYDIDNAPMFVSRAFHEGDYLPAKVLPDKYSAYVCWQGREFAKTDYEVLVGENYRFVSCCAAFIPPNAVHAGNTVDGEPLYVGRGCFEGSQTIGKIHPSHQCLYIPFGGQEHRLEEFEILIRDPIDIWEPTQSGQDAPSNAVVAGNDTDGSIIYVARAWHDGELIPGKFVPSTGGAYVSHGGGDVFKDEFEVLIGDGYSWVSGEHCGENIPIGAVSTGHTKNGEKVYVGRGHYRGSLTPGKVHPGKNLLYIPYGGKEKKITDYEILVKRY